MNALPSLIAEEEEKSMDSADEMCIPVSPEPAERMRPHIIRRMMMRHQQDTMIPWDNYTNTNQILSNKKKIKKQDKEIMKKELRFPSIVFNQFQKNKWKLLGEELAFFIITDKRNRLFFPRDEV